MKYPDTFTVVLRRPEGYDDVCAELCIEDAHIAPGFVIEDFCEGDAILAVRGNT